jgi:hypothetical protein
MVRARLEILFRWLGSAGIAFLVLITAYAALVDRARSGFRWQLRSLHSSRNLACDRLLRRSPGNRQAMRHRLLVTYLFIAVVPIVLIAGLAALGGYMLVYQLAAYLVPPNSIAEVVAAAAARGLTKTVTRIHHPSPPEDSQGTASSRRTAVFTLPNAKTSRAT